ncbi:PepSY-associated TM helix domain-containing protein [Bradyrhizobium sp. BR 10289]|uniref:PepSY-associated TM helix domain-containing protein n=1 Tax=Bradyrhizobium sp. BR 10289 TaxID=2749993 RepID=UPI001C64D2B3|nr:PepSY-associated TM helix domain-containing protein [Bradyrhizobium sp. BR 10289]
MNWLHTWSGVVLGSLLFAIFWMGTLSVFDKEIDRWMMPASRLALPPDFSYETMRPAYLAALAAKSPSVLLLVPNQRNPVITALWRGPDGSFAQHLFDPGTGAELPDQGTLGGSRFIYPFHYSLNLKVLGLGYWVVGLCGMMMMVLCVSGVVIHRKIFVDFFTFRPERKIRRATLDLHNVAGVLGLPFHVVISVSGLVILFSLYFPSSIWAVYRQDARLFGREAYGSYVRPPAKRAADLISLDAIVAKAKSVWGQGEPNYLYVFNPGDSASYVQLNRASADVVSNISYVAYVDGTTGELLSASRPEKPAALTQRFIAGLHFIQFEHWTLRWLYFVLGLAGCVLIATGLLFWVESRRDRHRRLGRSGARVVEAVTVASVTGILIATLAFMVTNRALPAGASVLGVERGAIEVSVFHLAWLLTLLHAWASTGRAWIGQCWMISGLASLAVLLNAVTTGDHLIKTIATPQLWSVAGVDATLLIAAFIAIRVALRLARGARPDAASLQGADQR